MYFSLNGSDGVSAPRSEKTKPWVDKNFELNSFNYHSRHGMTIRRVFLAFEVQFLFCT